MISLVPRPEPGNEAYKSPGVYCFWGLFDPMFRVAVWSVHIYQLHVGLLLLLACVCVVVVVVVVVVV